MRRGTFRDFLNDWDETQKTLDCVAPWVTPHATSTSGTKSAEHCLAELAARCFCTFTQKRMVRFHCYIEALKIVCCKLTVWVFSPKLCVSLTSLQGLWSKKVSFSQMGDTMIQGALCFMDFQVCFLKGVWVTNLEFYCSANLLFQLMSAKATHEVMYCHLTQL